MRSLLRRVSARLGLTDPVVTVITSLPVALECKPRGGHLERCRSDKYPLRWSR
jgi:hypothetical protein